HPVVDVVRVGVGVEAGEGAGVAGQLPAHGAAVDIEVVGVEGPARVVDVALGLVRAGEGDARPGREPEPELGAALGGAERGGDDGAVAGGVVVASPPGAGRSEEHTSELQSRENLVCRLLLEKKNKKRNHNTRHHYHMIRENM